MLWILQKLPVWLKSRLDPVELLIRIILGGIFIYSGIYKIKDPQSLEVVIRNYKILNDPFIALLAMTLPPLEIIIGACLLLKILFKGAVLISGSLLIVFIVSLCSLILRDLDIECGCLGLRTSLQMQIFIDSLLLLGTAYLFFSEYKIRLISLFKHWSIASSVLALRLFSEFLQTSLFEALTCPDNLEASREYSFS